MTDQFMFWFTIVVGIAAIIQAIYAVLSYHRASVMQVSVNSISKSPYRNLVLLVLLIWGAVIFNYYTRESFAWPPKEGPIFVTSYVGTAPGVVVVTVDTRPLVNGHEEKKNEYYILILCRWADNSVDTYSDKRIQKSNPFSITGEAINIEMSLSGLPPVNTPRIGVEFWVLVVPSIISPSGIENLQSALKAGGHIIAFRGGSGIRS